MRLVVLMIALLGLVGCGEHRPKPVSAGKGFPGEVVEADGHQVYFHCGGTGSPTVVFLNGHPEESYNWGNLFYQTARLTRACEYDRFGLGLTATYGRIDSKVRDAHDHVRELEQVLKNGDIHKPYVLVGHSWGGALAVLYAGTHDDVDGAVLVDGSVPGQDAVVHAALPPSEPASRRRSPRFGTSYPPSRSTTPSTSTGRRPSPRQARSRASATCRRSSSPRGTHSPATSLLVPVWLRLQSEQARLSSDSVHVLAPKSSHFVQLDAPDVVLASTRAVVDAVRNDRHLAPCAATFGRLADARCPG